MFLTLQDAEAAQVSAKQLVRLVQRLRQTPASGGYSQCCQVIYNKTKYRCELYLNYLILGIPGSRDASTFKSYSVLELLHQLDLHFRFN